MFLTACALSLRKPDAYHLMPHTDLSIFTKCYQRKTLTDKEEQRFHTGCEDKIVTTSMIRSFGSLMLVPLRTSGIAAIPATSFDHSFLGLPSSSAHPNHPGKEQSYLESNSYSSLVPLQLDLGFGEELLVAHDVNVKFTSVARCGYPGGL